jgi:uncharacterized protein (TIGR02996 family)
MNAPIERDRFLTALIRNEDDIPTRMAFADWLDENGEHEEADRNRRWPAAKQWIKALCDKHLPTEEYRKKYGDDSFDYKMSIYTPYEELIERGFESVADEWAVREKYLGIGLGASEWLCDDLREHAQTFWENWSIVTGIPVEAERVEKASFSCGC